MKLSRTLLCLALIGAAPMAFAADQVRRCKDASGHTYLTDRLCGDPATDRSGQRPPQIAVDQIQAEDIFRSRAGGEPTTPPPPAYMDTRDMPRRPDPASTADAPR